MKNFESLKAVILKSIDDHGYEQTKKAVLDAIKKDESFSQETGVCPDCSERMLLKKTSGTSAYWFSCEKCKKEFIKYNGTIRTSSSKKPSRYSRPVITIRCYDTNGVERALEINLRTSFSGLKTSPNFKSKDELTIYFHLIYCLESEGVYSVETTLINETIRESYSCRGCASGLDQIIELFDSSCVSVR